MLERLADGGVVVIDGGMGTELEARGARMDHEAWCGLVNLEVPGLVREIHEDYIRAGADVIIANTFPANRAAVDAALEARERAAGGREIAVAGSMSIWGPWEDAAGADLPSEAVLLEVYREQAGILAAAGVDLIVLEMLDVRWAPALTAAAETGLPVWAGIWAHEDGGRLITPRLGTALDDDLPALIGEHREDIAAVLVMHSAVATVPRALDLIGAHWRGPRGAYPHHGRFERPNWVFEDIAPATLADAAESWLDQGARLVGGCCGTGPAHIAAIRERVDGRAATA